MSYRFYPRQFVLLDSTSANSSTFTSTPQRVDDYVQMSVSWTTVGTGSSRLTLQGSNDDGATASLGTWSTITGITVQGLYTVTPGMRWLRAARSSIDSQAVVLLNART